MGYLEIAKRKLPPLAADGLSILGPHADRWRGRTLRHPWRGRMVDSPRGRGRLIWTDGFRAAIGLSPTMTAFVDLGDVRLAPARRTDRGRRNRAEEPPS